MIALGLREDTRNLNNALAQRSGEIAAARERLDSWKEIAAYFRRSVRCVQRWERAEGLPVLRHRHAKGATVYAYRDQLNEWWRAEGRVARNSARTEEEGSRLLRVPGGILRQVQLDPVAQKALVLLLQNILRTVGQEKVLRGQSRQGSRTGRN
jgi:hypothetical protein